MRGESTDSHRISGFALSCNIFFFITPIQDVHPDIRHPPPMLHKDHQQQTILWSNAAGMSGGIPPGMPPGMPPNLAPPPMGGNMASLMQGHNMQGELEIS